MKNSKFAVVFAIIGFLLSFVFALTSHSSFSVVLIKALITAVSFGVLGILISLIFSKFLDEDTASDGITEGDSERTAAPSQSKGQIVDLVVQDEELEKGESGNHFVVSDYNQMLNASDVSKNASQDLTKATTEKTSGGADNSGFVPLKFENAATFSTKEASKPESIVSLKDLSSNDDSSIDTLPDMSNIEVASDEKNEDNEDEDVSFTDNSDSSFSSSVSTQKTEFQGDTQNTELIAKAISSVLSAEKE